MKHIAIACAAGLAAALPLSASAVDTVVIGGNIWQCQNTCVVSNGMNGQLFVSDSQNGWVQMMNRRRIPVPNIAPTTQPLGR